MCEFLGRVGASCAWLAATCLSPALLSSLAYQVFAAFCDQFCLRVFTIRNPTYAISVGTPVVGEDVPRKEGSKASCNFYFCLVVTLFATYL